MLTPASASVAEPGHPSTPRERADLALLSSFVRFRRGEQLYREGDRIDALFNIVTGIVKSYTTPPDGNQHIIAFAFPDDLVGLAQGRTHTTSAEALTAVTAYRMPMTAIDARLRSDPELEFYLICQLSHELHQAQRHALLLSRHRAITRIGLFLQMLEAQQPAQRGSSPEIYLPMKRSDIGAYVGISLEAVGRSFRTLANRGAIVVRDRRHIRIINRAALEAAIFDGKRRR